MAIIRHEDPDSCVHVGCNNLGLCLWSDGLAIHQIVQEKQTNEDSRHTSGMNI